VPCSKDLDKDLTAAMTDLARVGRLTCAGCGMQVEQAARDWLDSNRPVPGSVQQVALLQHHEGWIYLRATFDSGRQIDCRFSGDRPIRVDLCAEVK
jgi:hypothetical protein